MYTSYGIYGLILNNLQVSEFVYCNLFAHGTYRTVFFSVDVVLPLTVTETKHILKNDLRQVWQLEWNKSKDSVLKDVEPIVSFLKKLWNLPRWQEIIVYRLRLGAVRDLKSYKYKIGKHPDGLCDVCLKYDDVRHFLISCKKYKESRLKLQNTLNYTNNQMTLKNILKEKFNIIHIIQFVKESGIKV